MDSKLVERYRSARRDPTLAVLEGVHPLKHALRFGAHVDHVATSDRSRVLELAASLAPDTMARIDSLLQVIDAETFAALSPAPPGEPVMALAQRPGWKLASLLASSDERPIVLLDDARHLGNLGACVRVAAAAGAAGVVAIGDQDPWHPHAIRGGAGLQFALPVMRSDELTDSDRPLIAIDPDGDELRPDRIPPRAILAFGSERRGLSPAMRDRASLRLGIPMEPGVSSLSLATAVAVVLFAMRMANE